MIVKDEHILGHESAGEVVAVHPSVTTHKPGDRVGEYSDTVAFNVIDKVSHQLSNQTLYVINVNLVLLVDIMDVLMSSSLLLLHTMDFCEDTYLFHQSGHTKLGICRMRMVLY